MRNFWVAVIGVLALTLFAGYGSATAPVAQDIPDIRLLTDPGSADGTLEDFDLNDYVTDYDDDPTSLNWTIESQVDFDSGNPATLAGSLADLAGKSAADQGTVTYRVADASEYSEDTQVVKYSTFWLTGPTLTQDNNLVPPNSFKRTWVLQGDEALTTPALATLSSITADFTVSIADLAGDLQAGNNETNVTYGGLNASIVGGALVLQAAAGTYPLAGDQLTEAYRVGIKAKPASGGLAGTEDNWDGAEILVSPSRFPTNSDQNTTDRVKRFNDFEITGTLPVELPVNQGTMRGLADAANPRWFKNAGTAGASAQIVASAPTTGSTAWASSGQALKVTLNSASDMVEVYSDWFTDIEPGETLICQANVSTSAAAGGRTPTFLLLMGNFHIHSNYEGVALSTPNDTDIQVPTGGADGWRTIQAKFKADTFAADVDGFNFYQRGYQLLMVFKGDAYGATYPFTFYVDNVRVYQAPDPIEAALGATAVSVTSQALSAPFDGTFEGATDLASSGFQVNTAENQGTAQIDTTGLNNMFSHDGSKALEVFIPGGLTFRIHTVYARVELAAGDAGPGIYGMTSWLKSNAGALKDLPDVMVVSTDPAFRNAVFTSTGIAALPLAGQGWKQISSPSYRVGTVVNRLWAYFIVKTAGDLNDYAYWPAELKGVNQPGYESDARIYIDDIKIHKYQDDVRFFDRSVFPAVD